MNPSENWPMDAGEPPPLTEHELLVRVVAACLAAGLITVAEVNDRSAEEVRALIAARCGYPQPPPSSAAGAGWADAARVDRCRTPLRQRVAAALRKRNQAELRVLQPIIWALAFRLVKPADLDGLTLHQALRWVAETTGIGSARADERPDAQPGREAS